MAAMTAKQQNAILARAEANIKAKYQEIYEVNKQEWNYRAVAAITMSIAMLLHDKYDWDIDKINELIEQVRIQHEDVSMRFLTMGDIQEACKEMGIVGV